MENDLTIASASVTDRGLSAKRPQNEDSFLELGRCGIYAVADGVGGAQGGEVASQMAIEILSEAFSNRQDGTDAEEILRSAIERANTAIYQMASELPALEGMATTIVALHLAGDVATIGHVGDSRLYQVDPRGELHQETDDHSMVADEVRAGRMTEEQAENHPGRNIINRALGSDPTVNIDLKTILVEPGATFMICSDGITRHVSDNEIKQTLAAGTDPESICSYLRTLCYERGAEDNLTAVVVKVGSRETATAPTDIPPAIDEEDTVASARATVEDEPEAVEEAITSSDDGAATIPVFSNTGTFMSLDEPIDDNASDAAWRGKSLIYVSLLLFGGVVGAAVYHFTMIQAPPPQPPALSEMKSDNIEITSFEKLRRTVDSDPAAYLKEVPLARDAEDHYLTARAHMLTGDFIKARISLLEAQKQLTNTEASNASVLATDIASALVIVNDAEMQKRFRAEIDSSSRSRTSTGSNTNVSR